MTNSDSSIHEKVQYLVSKIGLTLLALSVGVRDRGTLSKSEGSLDEVLTEENKLRVDVLFDVWSTVSDSEGDDTARAWLIGANPWLNEESAVTVIRDGDFHKVRVAACAMVDGATSFQYQPNS